MTKKTIKVCMAGFGNVGVRFTRLLLEKERELREDYGCGILVTGVCTRSKGTMMNPRGLDLGALLIMNEELGRFDSEHPDFVSGCDTHGMITAAGADLFIELSTLSIGDGEPAASYIREAFANGMDVITANKGPEAWCFDELKTLAEAAGKKFLYETIVMDGAPVFNMARAGLRGNRILALRGILNSTTNFILGELEKGGNLADAVAEAQRLQFAEADPSMDIDGWDGAAKICALANILMDARLTPKDVKVKSLAGTSAADVKAAGTEGCRIKYICGARRADDGSVELSVEPRRLPFDDPLCFVGGRSSALIFYTDLAGEIMLIERDPDILQTAYGVYSDLMTLIEDK